MSDTNAAPRSATNRLDAVLVILALIILGGAMLVLAFVHVPQENLPILASLASGILGTVIGSYVGFRWGASDASKRPPAAPQAVAVAVSEPAPDATAASA